MQKLTQKWAVIAPLEKVTDGDIFYYTDFPLHITLAGVFAVDLEGAELAQALADSLRDQHAIRVTSHQKDWFGPNKDVGVMKIIMSQNLMNLYNTIHNGLLSLGAVFNEPQYEGEGYLAHATDQKSAVLKPQEHVVIDSIALVDLFPNNDGYQRKIFKTITLSSADQKYQA